MPLRSTSFVVLFAVFSCGKPLKYVVAPILHGLFGKLPGGTCYLGLKRKVFVFDEIVAKSYFHFSATKFREISQNS
jgi:hypothetical protein